jgi:hypothetical protein
MIRKSSKVYPSSSSEDNYDHHQKKTTTSTEQVKFKKLGNFSKK